MVAFCSFFMAVLLILFSALSGFGQTIGVIGGKDNTNDYAAFINSGSTIPVPITPLPPAGGGGTAITSVVMNQLGLTLIGGVTSMGPSAYAAFIPPGSTTPLPINNLPMGGNCFVNAVALNNLGQGLIGATGHNAPYAAWVQYGSLTPISITVPNINSGNIVATALSETQGLIGGLINNFQDAYAAWVVFDSPTPNPIVGLPVGGFSHIDAVDLNHTNQALIGGQDNGNAYAAFLAPGSTTPMPIMGLPVGNSSIGATYVGIGDALNDAGLGLIGGNDNMNAYAAWVSFGSSLPTPIQPLPVGGNSRIVSVAFHNYGLGLIGGSNNADAYAAWIEPGSTVPIPITGLPTGGGSTIYSVSLNEFGQGLIGGNDNGNAYAALLAPGSTTPIPILNLPLGGASYIQSVFLPSLLLLPTNMLTGNNLRFANYINKYAPQDVFYFIPSFFNNYYTDALQNAAPTRNALSVFAADETLFYLNQSLSLHLRHNPFKKSRPIAETPAVSSRTSEVRGVIAQNLELGAEVIDAPIQDESEEPQPQPEFAADLPRFSPTNDLPWTFWVEGIGMYASQKEQHQTVGFQPYGGGVILATDKKIDEDIALGGGVAYTYTHVREDQHSGHSDINQEFCFFYMNWNYYGMHLDSGLWFGSFQTDQVRNIHMTAFEFKSRSHPWGLQLSPHLELGYNTPIMRAASGTAEFVVDPFFMLDWINNWQSRYREKGSGPFNAGQKAHYSSFLRSEIGYRVYEAFPFSSWRLILEEKLSYVNKTPFGVGKITSFLIGSPGSFIVETLTSSQNLGAAQMSFIFEPFDPKYPLGSFFYQAEFNGSSFQSHQVSMEVSWEF